ncbi:uncharacterized protein BN667_00055 [Clostridium sp. CAG:465]|nr:uncharacterized protein BN667_00055 [Clostridium sp. CAG:465]
MNKEPETYEELIRMKRCIELTKYYELSEKELEQIYDFLENNKNGEVICKKNSISLVLKNNLSNATVISSRCISSSIDGIIVSNTVFNVIPHYTPSSNSYYSRGSS